MKTGIVADVHIGNHHLHGGEYVGGMNKRCRQVIATLQEAKRVAYVEGCRRFVIAGDLFDNYNPSPRIMSYVMGMLNDGMETYVLVGNHESVSFENQDHGLGPLKFLENVTLIEKPERIGGMMLVPWGHQHNITKNYNSLDTLIFHAGIINKDTPPWLQNSEHAVRAADIKKLGYSAVFAGDWHNHVDFGDDVYQIGALCPTGWDNPGQFGDYGSLMIHDDGTGEVYRIEIPGPRFITEGELLLPIHENIFYSRPKIVHSDSGVSEEVMDIHSDNVLAEALKTTIDREGWGDDVFETCMEYLK